MKEPELEENALNVSVSGKMIRIKRRSLDDTPLTGIISNPQEQDEPLELISNGKGYLEARYEAKEPGIYTIDDGLQKRFAIVGQLNPPELKGVVTTDKILLPLIKESNGSVQWLADTPKPRIKKLSNAGSYGGRGWLGLRENNSYSVSGVKDHPFLPTWLSALLLFILLISAWWMEGRKNN